MLASIFSTHKNIAIKLLLLFVCFLFSQFVSIGISYSYSDAGDGNGGYGDTSTGNSSQSGTGDYDAGYGNTSSGHSSSGNTGDYDAGYGNTSSGHSSSGNTGDYDAGYSSGGGTSQSTSGNTSTGNTSQSNTGQTSQNTSGGTSSSNPQNTPDTSDSDNGRNPNNGYNNTYSSSGRPYNGELNIGAKVETINMTEVSATPESRSYSSGYQNAGAVGVIVEGPYMNGITPWFKVDYESGVDGWSTAVSFRLIATSTVSQTTATTSTTSTTSTTATTSTTSTTTDVAGTVGAAYSTFTGYFRTMTNFVVSSIRALTDLVMSVVTGGDNTSGDQFADLTNLTGSGISDSSGGTSGSTGGLLTTTGTTIDAPSLNLLREYLIEYRSSLEPITLNEPIPPPAEPLVPDSVPMPPVNVVSVTGVVNVSYSDGRGANQIISAALEGAGIPVINVPSDATGVNVRIQADCTSACLTYTGNFRDNVSTAGQLHVDISRPLTQSTVVGAVAGDMTSGSVGEFVEIRMASQSPVGTSAEQLEDLYTRAAGYSRPVTAYPLPPVSISGGIQPSSLSLSDYIFSEQAVAKVNQLANEATLLYPTEFATINSASELEWNQLYDQVLLQAFPPPHPELLDTDLGFLWSELTPTQRLQRLSDYIKGFNFAASLIFERKSVKQQVVVLTQSEGGNKDELDKLENQLANLETAINYTIFYLYEIDSELFNHSASVDRGSLPEQQVQALFEADFAYLSLSAVDAKLPDSNEIVPAVGDPDALYSQRKQWEEILLGILVGKPFAAMVDRTLGDNPVYPLPLPVPFSPSN